MASPKPGETGLEILLSLGHPSFPPDGRAHNQIGVAEHTPLVPCVLSVSVSVPPHDVTCRGPNLPLNGSTGHHEIGADDGGRWYILMKYGDNHMELARRDRDKVRRNKGSASETETQG